MRRGPSRSALGVHRRVWETGGGALVAVAVALLALGGCAANIHEVYYFKSAPASSDGKPVKYDPAGPLPNVFRLTVDGSVGFSSARYLSGFFDERAVDIFFNEIHSTAETTTRPLFPTTAPPTQGKAAPATGAKDKVDESAKTGAADPKDPGGGSNGNSGIPPYTLTSLDGRYGAFLMLLSSQTRAITDAIGTIAQSQNFVSAVTAALNKDVIQQGMKLQAEEQVTNAKRTSVLAELNAQATTLQAGGPAGNEFAVREMLLIVARARGDGAATGMSDTKQLVEYFNRAAQ